VQIEFSPPVVPEYFLTSIKRRKTGSQSSLSLLNRGKDSKGVWHPANAYYTLAHYVTDILDGRGKQIRFSPESPFAKRIGTDDDVMKFMEYLGWETEDEGFQPPVLDDESKTARILRKRLEAAELELCCFANETVVNVPKAERACISLSFLIVASAYDTTLKRADEEIAKVMAAVWPRTGLSLPTILT
jgi:hypothetical protein